MQKTGRARAIRFSTLEKLCEVLDRPPGDLFAFEKAAANAASDDALPRRSLTAAGDDEETAGT